MTPESRAAINAFLHQARLGRVKPFVTHLAREVGVTPQAIYGWEKLDAEVRSTLADLKVLRERRRTEPKRSHGPNPNRHNQEQDSESQNAGRHEVFVGLTDSDLASHAQADLMKLRLLVEQARGVVVRHSNIADLPFVVYKLDRMIDQFQPTLQQLRLFRDEWQRRNEPRGG